MMSPTPATPPTLVPSLAPTLAATTATALALLERALDALAPGWDTDPRQVAAAQAASEAYTRTRQIDRDLAASPAYLAHFGPRAIAATARAAASLQMPAEGIGHVLDIGAGSGAAALWWHVAGASALTLMDHSAQSLQTARRLLTAAGVTRLETATADFHTYRNEEADLLSATFMLGELRLPGAERSSADRSSTDRDDDDDDDDDDDARGQALLQRLRDLAPRARRWCLVDAGDHQRARRLQHLRRHWLAAGGTIHGPCPHADDCPALTRARDWCHVRTAKVLPPRLASFARAVGRSDAAMSLAFLAGTPPGLAAAPEPGPRRAGHILVLGPPHAEKGRVRVPVCGPPAVSHGGPTSMPPVRASLRSIMVLKRHKDAARAAAALQPGDLLAVPPPGDDVDSTGDPAVQRWASAMALTPANEG